MNTTFNFDRLGLLIKRYFIENKNKELMYWGILTLVFCLNHQTDSARMIIYIMGFIFAAKLFKIFSYTPGGMHYLLIPATHLEKLVANILLSTVYFFGMILLTFSIGNIIGTNLINALFNQTNSISWDMFSLSQTVSIGNNIPSAFGSPFIGMIFTFFIIQSVFLLGSIYFKRGGLGRTMLSIFGFFLLLVIIELFMFKVMFGSFSVTGNMMASFNFTPENSPTIKIIGHVFKVMSYLLTPFLWVVTYFRLTEKQV